MSANLDKLKSILGDEYLQQNATPDESDPNSPSKGLTNSKEIYCECNTLILRPKHARLIVPSESMIEMERGLNYLQESDKFLKQPIRGCYWLVEDMYKFEHVAFTKPIGGQRSEERNPSSVGPEPGSQVSEGGQERGQQDGAPGPAAGLRYLACAECYLCPLGWSDPRSKENYLFVW